MIYIPTAAYDGRAVGFVLVLKISNRKIPFDEFVQDVEFRYFYSFKSHLFAYNT